MPNAKVYLIPVTLHQDEAALQCLPAYIADAVKECAVFYAENQRTARRFLKKILEKINIDAYEWHTIDKAGAETSDQFKKNINEEKTIGIMSEAGCPGIADPGQELVMIAQQMNTEVIPLVGPSAVTLALMASGMNGQCFRFVGYLPVQSHERKKTIYELENDSVKRNCTQIFIETPYRNNQLLNDLVSTARPHTWLCIATDLTAPTQFIRTKKIGEWKNENINLHKRPAIFLLYSGR